MSVAAITGVSGYLGHGLVQRLGPEQLFDRILGIDIRPASDNHIAFMKMDIRDPGLTDLFQKESVTHVVHLAFVVNPTHDSEFEEDVDVNGTRNLLKACHEARVKKLVIASSIGAYGWHADNPIPIPETFALRGNSEFPYSRNKTTVEHLVAEFAESHPRCDVVVLRICNVLGPHVHNAISAGLEALVIMGVRGCDPFLAFTHEEDMNEILFEALRKPVRGVFNVAGDGMLRLSTMARLAGRRLVRLPERMVRGILNFLFWCRLLPFGGGQLGFVQHSCIPDTSKLRSEFGYHTRYTSEETFLGFVRERLKRKS